MFDQFKTKPVHLYHTSLTTERPVFADEADKYNFLTMLGKAAQRSGIHTDGFCLLDNTVHVLMDSDKEDVSGGGNVLRECFENDYVNYFRRRHHDERTLYSESHCEKIEGVNEAVKCLGRLHVLPVSTGHAKELDDYWWTSWQTYRERYIWDFIDSKRTLSLLDEDQERALRQLRKKQRRLLSQEMSKIKTQK